MSELSAPIPEADIEGVARLMCLKMGMNPDDSVGIEPGSDQTPWEKRGYSYALYVYHSPLRDAPPLLAAHNSSCTIYVPRWRQFRRDAAIIIAGWRAVHEYALTGM